MDICVNGVPIHISPIERSGATSLYYVDDTLTYFVKQIRAYKEYNLIEREVFFLKKLEKYNCFPTYISHTETYIVMSYIGKPITCENKPTDLEKQLDTILSILETEGIRHCDIKKDELVVDSDGRVHLVDFGWAQYNGTWGFLQGLPITKPAFLDISDRNMIDIIIASLV